MAVSMAAGGVGRTSSGLRRDVRGAASTPGRRIVLKKQQLRLLLDNDSASVLAKWSSPSHVAMEIPPTHANRIELVDMSDSGALTGRRARFMLKLGGRQDQRDALYALWQRLSGSA
jgi:hypothetical protein